MVAMDVSQSFRVQPDSRQTISVPTQLFQALVSILAFHKPHAYSLDPMILSSQYGSLNRAMRLVRQTASRDDSRA